MSLLTTDTLALRDDITEVRLGPIEDGVETFTFYLRDQQYKAVQTGRLRDLCLGHGEHFDRSIAVMAIVDDLATRVGLPRVSFVEIAWIDDNDGRGPQKLSRSIRCF